MSKRILVISPHADDEILGCGGYLASQRDEGSEIHIAYATIGIKGDPSRELCRIEEAEQVCNRLKASHQILLENYDGELDMVPTRFFVTEYDTIFDSFRPDELFINYPSWHQDHKKVYDSAMAALRFRQGFMPRFIALYEYPFILNQNINISGGLWYHDITDSLDEKIEVFNLYKSQIKKAPSPLNPEGIRQLAMVRGTECGVKYAELFYLQKMIR
ncbi:MAG: PIG-L family deacetylase [Bacteroidales bacterium]|nr:PIG-L family deacetylase [Bacteroidales bacterium]